MADLPVTPWLTNASRNARYLVGVSGGADSVALLHILVAHGFHNLVVCHIDHGMRGRESTADARFVAKLAQSLDLSCELAKVNVKRLAKATRHSLETAGRHARHGFFADCAQRHRCSRVLLAHHSDDQAETVLWNLLRGSYGLKGMRETHDIAVHGRRLRLIRPLLDLRRDALRGWLQARGHTWREDATNAVADVVRNRLRLEAIPLLETISDRDITPLLCRAAEAWSEQLALNDWAVAQARALDPQGRIHLPVLRTLPEAVQRAVIHRYLTDHRVPNIDRDLIDRALLICDTAAAPALNLPGGKHLRRRHARLFIADLI